MKRAVAVQIPLDWLEGIPPESTTLQHIFRMGLYHYKVERAIAMYRDGVGSLGYIAEQLGLSKRDLIREARLRGIVPDVSEETIREEIGNNASHSQ
ncbi:hypothetical protein HRbin16_02561 [bacterium HR16]|nr:hypothetical protein HRbin16_02561 [bacterium HR16]